jgi:uncharacterized protein involved in outer membrane biogenesis
MKKLLVRIGIGVIALVGVVTVVSVLFIGSVVKKGVETLGPRVTKVEVKLDSADIWLLLGRAHLKGLFVGNPSGFKAQYAIQVNDINVRVKPMSAFSDKLIFDSIVVKSPEVWIEGGLKKNNLTQIQQNINAYGNSGAESSPAAGGAPAKPARKLQVNDLVITGTRVHFASPFSSGSGITIPIPDIHLTDLGTDPAGITAADVVQKAINELVNSIAANAADAIGKMGKDAAKGIDVNKIGGKLKSLFGQ